MRKQCEGKAEAGEGRRGSDSVSRNLPVQFERGTGQQVNLPKKKKSAIDSAPPKKERMLLQARFEREKRKVEIGLGKLRNEGKSEGGSGQQWHLKCSLRRPLGPWLLPATEFDEILSSRIPRPSSDSFAAVACCLHSIKHSHFIG